jgi:hypothetical protein
VRNDTAGALRTAPKGAQGGTPTEIFLDAADIARRPNALAVDETHVYWVDDGKVRAMSKAAGEPSLRELASGSDMLPAIAIDATHVYWTNATQGTILRVPKEGGDPETLTGEQNDPEAIAVDEAAIYWTNFGRGDLVKRAKPGPP